ncbi:MAG: anaerobic nitric oxide reductase transcription regulator [Planctomycetota bacterium]|jgi:anaerobic nitric oxide reductase transcription regulator
MQQGFTPVLMLFTQRATDVLFTTYAVFMTTPSRDDLLPIALDISASLSTEDRLRRLVEVVSKALPCDAVALLRLEDEQLVPVAASGLSDDIFGRRFLRSEHPRLDSICGSEKHTLFAADSPLPDPYDGLVEGASNMTDRVHSCLGCPLRVEGELVGVLTVDALQPGAFDHIQASFLAHLGALAGAALRTSDLIAALERRAEHQGLLARDLMQDTMARRGATLIGDSTPMNRLRKEIEVIARSDFPVLVTGETGVGKEIVVRQLHAASRRAEQALVYLNCAALPEAIAESELFGHTRGAFTGADSERLGKFRVADKASLFLDEIGELPLHIQPKLLRALQDGEIQCVGTDQPIHVDVRILAATNRNLEAEVEAGRFRSDLLHRLDVCRLHIPPLRERAEDIPALAGFFADRGRRQLGTGPIRFSPEAQENLMAGSWPGNVRELENVVSRGILSASTRSEPGSMLILRVEDFDTRNSSAPAPQPSPESTPEPTPRPLREAVESFQRTQIEKAVGRNQGNWSAAARDLALDRGNLYHLAKRLGIKK